MTRARTLHDLGRANVDAHRRMLEQALAAVDDQLAALDREGLTRLGASVVLYDGVCNVCSGSVRFILPRDRRPPSGSRRSSPPRRRACSRPGPRAGTLDSLVLIEDGRCYERSEAALRIARRLSFPWKIAPG